METVKCFEANKYENTTYKNIWDKAKVVVGGEFIAVNVYIEKEERSYINNLTFIPKEV